MIGSTISHYKVLSEVGRGGMGVVYKAEDLKLKRTVALKFPPIDKLASEEEKARFLREAEAAAALNHPNICTVYEIGEAEGHTFIAMEFVEGQSVKDRVRARPAPLDEALDIAIQAAQGLQAAHEEGTVHRDIKSANLMVTPKGQVKVMDFGLAQVGDRSHLTKTGTTLGTPAYMSPEQAKAEPTDRRSDIWSLGVVLYEMLTGQLPFKGEVEAAVAYAVVNTEPEPPTALRSGLPIEIDRVVDKALAKDPDERYQHIEGMLVDLRALQRSVQTGDARAVSRKRGPARKKSKLIPRIAFGVLVLFLAALGVYVVSGPERNEFGNRVVKFVVAPGEDVHDPVVSPDGRYVAFVTFDEGGALWIRELSEDEPRRIKDSEGAIRPFWSPDSRQVAFGAGTWLKRVGVDDNATPATICELPGTTYRGGTWSPEEDAIFVGQSHRVRASGGLLERIASAPEGFLASDPELLPVSDRHLLLIRSEDHLDDLAGIYLFDLDRGAKQRLVAGRSPAYSPTGHILYQEDGPTPRIRAIAFSLETLKTEGDTFVVAENATAPSVSNDGTLVYLSGAGSERRVVWRDRSGALLGAATEPLQNPRNLSVAIGGRRCLHGGR